MKILNLYAGIGGNRKYWDKEHTGEEHDITAIELNPNIAKIYQDFFEADKVLVCDAHHYLEQHYLEFDFIWSSPPCPTHSNLRKGLSMASGAKAVYPDMKLYEEILFLKGYFKGNYCVENVIGWYEPLTPPYPQEIQRHYFWCNFHISQLKEFEKDSIRITGGRNSPEWVQIEHLQKRHGIILPENTPDRRTLLRNCVSPNLGLHILNESKKGYFKELFK